VVPFAVGLEHDILELQNGIKNIRFDRVVTICSKHFGKPRIRGSHHIFSMPWSGDPRINLQAISGGKSKPEQIRQVLRALVALKEEKHGTL
jgi:hypothetical protein